MSPLMTDLGTEKGGGRRLMTDPGTEKSGGMGGCWGRTTLWLVLALAQPVHLALAQPPAVGEQAVGEPAPAGPSPATTATHVPLDRYRLDLSDLGLDRERLSGVDRSRVTGHFRARSDSVLTGATLDLEVDMKALHQLSQPVALEVLINGERAARLNTKQLAAHSGLAQVELAGEMLEDSNALTLALSQVDDDGDCTLLPAGTWSLLKRGHLQLTSARLPLPVDLAQLPLPFLDTEFDRDQRIQFVLPRVPSPEGLQAASLVAGWLALQGRGRLSFSVHLGEIPKADAVVFLDSEGQGAALGLSELGMGVGSAGLSMMEHPRSPQRRLLVVAGPSPTTMLNAAGGLVRDGYVLSGPKVSYTKPVELQIPPAGSVPRWVTGPRVTLGALPLSPPLRLEGGRSGNLVVPFRLPPDLFLWPEDSVPFTVDYAQGISSARGLARLHLALNGRSLGALAAAPEGRADFRVPRELLRGYNQLLLQVSYPGDQERQRCDLEDDADAWVALKPSSTLHLGGAGSLHRYASWPDLQTFLDDGFPFTAQADLGQTTFVLPPEPQPGELSTVLSLVAHFAAVTGAVSAGARFVLGAAPAEALRDRDLLFIAAAPRVPALGALHPHLPLTLSGSQALPRRPTHATWWRRLLQGRFYDRELERARAAFPDRGAYAAVVGLASPFHPSRAAVLVTAASAKDMPTVSELQGHALAESLRNDVLLLHEGRRYLFEIGLPRGRGELPRLTELRVRLARHWTLLLLVIAVAAAAFATVARDRLSARARARLQEAES